HTLTYTTLYRSIRFLPIIVTKLGPHTLREQEVKCTIFMDELTTDVQHTLLEIENVIGKLRNIKINNREKELRIDFISLIEAKEHSRSEEHTSELQSRFDL